MHKKFECFHASKAIIYSRLFSPSSTVYRVSFRNFTKFRAIRYNNIFCYHLLKSMSLNFFSFSTWDHTILKWYGQRGTTLFVPLIVWLEVVSMVFISVAQIEVQCSNNKKGIASKAYYTDEDHEFVYNITIKILS